MRFGRKGKLVSRYVGSYEIVERIGFLAYRLLLPSELFFFYDVFYVSMLRKYESDPFYVFGTDEVELDQSLSYQEYFLQIFGRKEK